MHSDVAISAVKRIDGVAGYTHRAGKLEVYVRPGTPKHAVVAAVEGKCREVVVYEIEPQKLSGRAADS